MSFLYPAFLFGLLAVSIPIIIHLFNFHRPKKVLFTNVKFLKDVKETTNQKLKLKHLLILASRILFIVFLALTFAQPFLQSNHSNALNGPQFVSVYLDNSFSMQNEIEKEKAMDIAIKSINKLTETYPSNTQYYLLTNDFEGKDQFIRNKEKLNERLTEIKYSNLFRDANSIYKRQLQGLNDATNSQHHIFWFTDFQKSTIGNLDKITLDTTSRLYLVPIQNKESSNISIDSIWLGSPMIKANENNSLEVRIKNEGDRSVKELILKLYIDNVQVSTSSVSMEPNTKAIAKFVFNVTGDGQKKCRVAFEDFPITFDNEYNFVLNVSPKIKILHLYDQVGKFINNVYSNENVFALESHSIGDFDNSLVGVSNLVVLDGVKEIPSSIIHPMKEFVKNGGTLIIYPSENPNIDSYNELLTNLYIPKIARSNTTISPVNGDSSFIKASHGLQAPDFKNPFFQGLFEKNEKGMNMPFALPVISWAVKGDVLLKFKNDEPFLSLFPSEKGKVYLAATPLQERYTNFANHSIFVLVMYKAGFNSITEGERLAYSFQDPTISVDLENYNSEKLYTLSSGDFKIIPGQRIVGRKLILEVPKDQLKPGFYELKSGDKVEKWLAFNYGKEESIQEFYDSEYLTKSLGQDKNVQVYNVDNAEDFIKKFKNENIGVPLWKYCLILCLVFLAIEILLIRFL